MTENKLPVCETKQSAKNLLNELDSKLRDIRDQKKQLEYQEKSCQNWRDHVERILQNWQVDWVTQVLEEFTFSTGSHLASIDACAQHGDACVPQD